MKILLAIILSLLVFTSCARESIKTPQQAMRLAQNPPELTDDLPLQELELALGQKIIRLKEVEKEQLIFGPATVSKDEYILALKFLEVKLRSGISKEQLNNLVNSNFDFYEVYGKEDWGDVLITSYYEPVLDGSTVKSGEFTQPLYSVPDDFVTIHLDKFVDTFDKLSPIKDEVLDNHNNIKVLRGRVSLPYVEGGSQNVVPYYTRKEIDSDGKLSGRGLELAWVDPIDAFFLHVQGSGTVLLDDRTRLRLGYASKNGFPFYAIGKHLLDTIPKEKMSMQSIEQYLRSLPESEMREILNLNKSYVFFRKLETRPITSFGTEVVDGRTIATDKRFFPMGSLGFLEFEKPVFDSPDSRHPSSWEKTSRFVLDHDTGGAIKGTHRVDLFWGSGKEAGQSAGVMKQWGKLYYLVPKDSLLQKFKPASN
ncbi:MAG: transglycosylase [Candidatus Dadabacteria bacterium]|nr:transglycosylase [Candidatus Dadabacteria bacterium]NIS08985.1 transglycosylase [Candidatus Dadabacteria bacterium]NIV41028.1 transglycosylase [Candidatus Dadabacteria bacterium]NIX15587.1 transglycosylase [Candidatus Dadabacteria bacterium]NIY22328.1 transglycosylase [Candidatus Dadabacteria bacterium]